MTVPYESPPVLMDPRARAFWQLQIHEARLLMPLTDMQRRVEVALVDYWRLQVERYEEKK